MHPLPSERGSTGASRPLRTATAGAILALLATLAQATLPVETLTTEPLAPASPGRIYLTDPVMAHLADGRVLVVDSVQGKRLGVIGSGFSALTTLSPDRQWLYVATTYHSRLQRGTRTDVVEVYKTADLSFSHEIEIPPKHAQGLPTRPLMTTSADGRFLLIQNATPATSVTVVDTQARQVTAEIANPGCWGVMAWPGRPSRYSSICGDGTLQTVDLDAAGKPAGQQRSAKFFDPDVEPVYTHYALRGDTVTLVGFAGSVHQVTLAGEAPRFAAPWNFVDTAARKQGWKPGGYQLFDVLPDGSRLLVGMHPKAAEGTHKNPAEQLWAVDLAARKVVARAPGHLALSMTLTREARPKLVVLSAADNSLVTLDPLKPATKPLARTPPMGETPIYLESH